MRSRVRTAQRERLARAFGIIAALFLAAVVATIASWGRDAAVYRNFVAEFADASDGSPVDGGHDLADTPLMSAKALSGLLGSADAAAEQGLPEGFEEELFSVGRYSEVLVSRNGTVVGLVGEGRAADEMADLTLRMVRNGWTVATDAEGSAESTFLKTSGRYRWAVIAGVDVSGTSSLVVTIA